MSILGATMTMNKKDLEQQANEILKSHDATHLNRKNREYPYLTERQIKSRAKREVTVSNLPTAQKRLVSVVMYSICDDE